MIIFKLFSFDHFGVKWGVEFGQSWRNVSKIVRKVENELLLLENNCETVILMFIWQ